MAPAAAVARYDEVGAEDEVELAADVDERGDGDVVGGRHVRPRGGVAQPGHDGRRQAEGRGQDGGVGVRRGADVHPERAAPVGEGGAELAGGELGGGGFVAVVVGREDHGSSIRAGPASGEAERGG